MKVNKTSETETEFQDEHELLIQEDFKWLAELRDALSPYWASTVTRQETLPPILSIQGIKTKRRSTR